MAQTVGMVDGVGEAVRRLREMSRAQAALLDQLVNHVAREHVVVREREGSSREHRLLEQVRVLLAGGHSDRAMAPGSGFELDYDLDARHLGVIARGAGGREAIRSLARSLEQRLLSVSCDEVTVWAWLGGSHVVRVAEVERVLSAWASRERDLRGVPGNVRGSSTPAPVETSFAVGEPAQGLEGWRLTHRQAQAALLVALRRPRPITRYENVALLAAALKDDLLSSSLIEMYLSPLEDARGGGVLRQTLHAYFAAERNASSAAVALGVVRNTVENRLRTIEERLDRPLHSCIGELEVALELDELEAPCSIETST